MTEALAEWVRTLAIGALFTGAVASLVPEGSEKRAVKLVCGIVMTLLLLAPLKTLDTEKLARQPTELKSLTDGFREEAGEISNEAAEVFIKDAAEEYILDAARRLGARQPGVRLTFRGNGAQVSLWAAELTGVFTEEQRRRLSLLLDGELGIPPERQTWSVNDAG